MRSGTARGAEIGTKSTPRGDESVRRAALRSTVGGGWSPLPLPGWGVRGLPRPSFEPQVRLEPVPAALSAEAGLLVAAEGRRGVEAVVRVRPDHAGTQAL